MMLKTVKNTLKDFSNFLKCPADKQDINQSKQQKTKRLFSLLAIDIPIMILLSMLMYSFDKLGWVEIENHKVGLQLDSNPVWLVLLFAVIILPFVEEIIFRLFLRFKKNYPLRVVIAAFPRTKKVICSFWNKKYGYVFYLAAVAFALLHIKNYDFENTKVFIFPILVLPQFMLGLFIGYLRVRYNFMLGYLLHALHNAVFITVALLSINETSDQKLDITTNKYSLKIEEVKRENYSYTNNYNQDSISFIGIDFKSIISTLTKKDLDLIESNNETLLNKKITLNYKNSSPESLNRDSLILEHLSEVYSFKIETKQRNQKVYTLYVKDTLQLFKHLSQKKRESNNISTSISSENITFENTTLEQVAKTLSSSYKMRFEVKDEFSKEFNINVPNGSFSQLENVLKTNYGIYLEEIEKKIEYIYLNFQE